MVTGFEPVCTHTIPRPNNATHKILSRLTKLFDICVCENAVYFLHLLHISKGTSVFQQFHQLIGAEGTLTSAEW